MMEKIKTFEETYPQYPFAELVRLFIALGRLIGDRRRPEGAGAAATRILRRAPGSSQIQAS